MLEQVVRPFVRPNSLATRRLVATAEKIDVEPAIITWGAVGSIPGAEQVEQLGGAINVITCDDFFDEIDGSRKSNTYRITQKLEDGTEVAENFIDIARPYQLAFHKNTDQPNYDKTTTWKTSIETADFQTNDINDEKCKATYNLKIEVPT